MLNPADIKIGTSYYEDGKKEHIQYVFEQNQVRYLARISYRRASSEIRVKVLEIRPEYDRIPTDGRRDSYPALYSLRINAPYSFTNHGLGAYLLVVYDQIHEVVKSGRREKWSFKRKYKKGVGEGTKHDQYLGMIRSLAAPIRSRRLEWERSKSARSMFKVNRRWD